MELYQTAAIAGRPQAEERNMFMPPLDAQLRGQRFTRPPQWSNPVVSSFTEVMN